MDSSSFPTTAQVRRAHPGELAVLMSAVTGDVLAGLSLEQAEVVVVATQRVASWAHGVQAMAVDRFAEHVLDAQEARAADLAAARDAQRESVEAGGGTWRGESGAVGMPEPEQVAASMLAPELRISPRTMRTRLARARALMELPHTLGLALAGDLEPWRAEAVVVASQDVAADRLVELECRLYAADVIDLPKPRLVERVRRAAAKADPEAVTRGVRRAPRRRSLRVAPSETAGLMRWSLELPDELSRRMFAAVDDLAQEYLTADRVGATGPGSAHPRTVEAGRLDALGDLVMANAHVETVIDLVVPGRRRYVDHRHPQHAARRRHRRAHEHSLTPRTPRVTRPRPRGVEGRGGCRRRGGGRPRSRIGHQGDPRRRRGRTPPRAPARGAPRGRRQPPPHAPPTDTSPAATAPLPANGTRHQSRRLGSATMAVDRPGVVRRRARRSTGRRGAAA